MKAVRQHEFGEANVLRLETGPDLTPTENQVLVEIRAIGVNPVDVYIRSGNYGPRAFPLTLGLDAAGVVKAVGSGVKSVKPGDRVFVYGSASGTYADQCLCEEYQVHRLPASLSFEQGAAVGATYLTAYYALQARAQAKKGETVLIHGASGGVGTAAVQVGQMMDLTVWGTAGSQKGLEHVRAQGAAKVFDHRSAGYAEQILEATAKRGVDIILEMLANVNLARDTTLVAKGGRIVVIGSRGTIEINPRELMTRNASILGMSVFNATAFEAAQAWLAIEKGLDQGLLKPVVGRTFSLADAGKAHEAVMASGAMGKILLIP